MTSWTQTPYTDNPVRAVLLLGCRVVLGLVLVAHGWEKLTVLGLAKVAESFDALGVPLPQVSAVLVALVELVGGVCILLGAFTWVACTAVSLVMFGAYWFVHRGHGVPVDKGGWELVGALGVAALLLALTSPGDLSVDGVVNGPDEHAGRRGHGRRGGRRGRSRS